jgi:uncharacterized protein (UPF0264 family)
LKLLISSVDEKEAAEAIAGSADIVDVKNPREGALGASFPWVVKRIRELAPSNVEVSCALGDVPNLPGAISLAALGAATTGVAYIKAGLYGLKTKEEAVYLMQNVAKAVRDYDSSIKVAAVGYADAARVVSVNPILVPRIAKDAGVHVAMLDTAIKDGKDLFAFLTTSQLKNFIDEAHALGLEAALAGSLKKNHLSTVYSLGADVVGFRGAACTFGDRVNGRITEGNVRELADVVRHLKGHVKVRI